MKFTAWVTGRDSNDDPYADQVTAEGTREQAEAAFEESRLQGETIRSIREGEGGTDITLRGGPS